ncbi:hypothetical protein SO802_014403 [Lithocarpus litseifolius]|uniref:Leucine-rich repeat-containing N-terminal plant-type domain-containing protein n=1 Tax=Lithocarpus litseifolius TaxID=425828 RepID=A0AAW2CQU6_9ROSI
MRWFIWLSQLFYLLLLFYSQLTSSSSSSFNSSSPLLCSQDQSSALLQFKQLFSLSEIASLDCDISYPKMEFWKEGTDCCSWDGVTCDSVRGDVIGLDLSCSMLESTIPSNASLFLLPHLQRLNLAFNDFNISQIPSGFGRFAKLRYLNLSHSLFDGQVPLELSHLSQLSSLDLSGNFHVSFETSVVKRLVQNLTKLRELHLDEVNMSSVSLTSFRNLSSLASLSLEACKLSGSLPDLDIFGLQNLRELNLGYNFLIGEIPSSFSNLKALSSLSLGGNYLNGTIPLSLSNLKELSYLDLHWNNLSGRIPSSLLNLKELSSLILTSNSLCGKITSSVSIRNTQSLENLLNLTNCFFVGPIPVSFGNLTKVTQIILSHNYFTGQIPSSLSNMKYLNFINLSYNKFEGSMPISFGNLTKVTDIMLQYNNITGQILSSLSNLKYLNVIDLSYNKFEVVENQQFLDLHANLLQGNLPVPPSTMIAFFMSNNGLTGEISSMICNASHLEILDISNNNLSGKIPQCLGNFGHHLSVMDLRMNNFHGTIPDTFEKDNSLATIALNGNHLEGKLPKSFVNCTNLEVLDLRNNKINDSFPYWLEALSELRLLVLSNNKFHGPIRNHKNKGLFFSKLQILDLSHNEFTGLLPRIYFENLEAMMISNENAQEPQYLAQHFGNYNGYVRYRVPTGSYQDSIEVTVKWSKIELPRILTIFTIIDLSSNQFQGEIPHTLGRLKFLRLLNLSHNSLTGHIPSTLGNLLALEALDFSSNKLTVKFLCN